MQLLMLGQRLDGSIAAKLTADGNRLAQRAAKLEALSPLGILSRGYSVATTGDGKVLSSVKDAHAGDDFTLQLTDGKIKATVKE